MFYKLNFNGRGRWPIVVLALICVLTLSASITFSMTQIVEDSFWETTATGLKPWLFGIVGIIVVVSIHAIACSIIFRSFLANHLSLPRLILSVLVLVMVHAVEIHIFASLMYVFAQTSAEAGLDGAPSEDFINYIYFSFATYTSLGLGDIYPMGGLRLLSGLEALTGLLMIGWSASLNISVLGKYWLTSDAGDRKK